MPSSEPAEIIAKRHAVREDYRLYGCQSDAYRKSFDELQEMTLLQLAGQFRQARGLPPDAKTPYCPDTLKTSLDNQGSSPCAS